jgi:hypothetical protein
VRTLVAAGKDVVIVGPVPEMGFDAGRCVIMSAAAGRSLDACDVARANVEARQAYVTSMLDQMRALGARIVDPRAVLCDAVTCHGSIDGAPAYRDDNHLSAAGAARVVARMAEGVAW